MKKITYTNTDKKDVLISALEERYKALHVIRERVQSIGVWALGLMTAAAGWLLQGDIWLNPGRKFLYLVVLGITFWALRFKYLEDLQKGFVSQLQVAVRIEEALGLYESGVFDRLKKPIYPTKWKKAGGKHGDGKFFSSTYLLLYIGIAILAGSILLSRGGPRHFWH